MKINAGIVQLSSEYILSCLEGLTGDYCYHNESHIISVVNAINEISEAMKLTDHERYILLTAGWFHDVGYLWQIEEHEAVSARLAGSFLADREVNPEDIDQVKKCITATRCPQKPLSLLEEVISDADLIHIGEKDFFEKAALVREEWRRTRQLNYTDREWYQVNLDFVRQQSFHTAYCRKHYNSQKEKNIKHIETLLKDK